MLLIEFSWRKMGLLIFVYSVVVLKIQKMFSSQTWYFCYCISRSSFIFCLEKFYFYKKNYYNFLLTTFWVRWMIRVLSNYLLICHFLYIKCVTQKQLKVYLFWHTRLIILDKKCVIFGTLSIHLAPEKWHTHF